MSRTAPSTVPASPRVIIIGAGIAGLTAARTLLGSGVREVLVLEGRSRIGGRIYTDMIGPKGVPINIGAHFIHGCGESGCNLLLDFCKQHQITTVDFSDLKELYFTGKQPAELASKEDMENAVHLAKEFDEALWKAERTSDSVKKAVDTWPNKSELSEDAQQLFLELVRSKHAYAGPINDVSVAGARDQLKRHHHRSVDDKSCGSRILPYGFSHVIQHLAQGLAANILMDRPVARIEQCGTYVAVTTATSTPETFFADAVIVTVPLGVLKSGAITFSPPLSERKQHAIQSLGFGVQNRVYLTFDRVYWDDSAHTFHCVSDPRYLFFNMNRYGLGPMISIIVRPPFSSELDQLTDEQAIDEIMKVLRKMFPEMSKPTSFKISRWGKDPFARGSFSYIPAGASLNEVRDLARPEGRLFFAGEATSEEEMQMARGAFTSALRVASEVIAHFRHPRPAAAASTATGGAAVTTPAATSHVHAHAHAHAHSHALSHAPAMPMPLPMPGYHPTALPDPYQMPPISALQQMLYMPPVMSLPLPMAPQHGPHIPPVHSRALPSNPALAHQHQHHGMSPAHGHTHHPAQHGHSDAPSTGGASATAPNTLGMLPPFPGQPPFPPMMYYMGMPSS